MTTSALESKLRELMGLPAETEWLEFKEAKNDLKSRDLGEYFSALSNEANLKGQPAGWLILGVTDKPPRRIVGTNYRPDRPALDKLKQLVAENTNGGITFEEIHEILTPEGRVLMFEIPPALRGIPTSWKRHFYGRHGESSGALTLTEIEHIRAQVIHEDWSAGLCEDATLDDLDPEAVAFAREQYAKKHPPLAAEAQEWDTLTFLSKAKVCKGAKVTRAAMLLLGGTQAEVFLSPSVAHITWVVKDASGMDRDYQHFGPPLILAVDRVFAKIRNLTYRHLPDQSLFPMEITQYEPWVIRETLHNCIAHQDYTLHGRINLVEEADSLLFTNVGEFLPGSVEEVIRRDAPPEVYRNPLLADAMVNLNMIDTIGSGIRRMFSMQRQRNFPMPDYDLGERQRVKVRITGKVLDERYTRTLIARSDLALADVIALDKVQKGKRLTEEEFRSLKTKKLVEGRRPNLFVSAEVAAATDTKADYIRKRALDKGYYKKLIADYLEQFGEGQKADFDRLLMSKLSDALDDEQKRNFLHNLLQEMRREGTIERLGPKRRARWVLAKP